MCLSRSLINHLTRFWQLKPRKQKPDSRRSWKNSRRKEISKWNENKMNLWISSSPMRITTMGLMRMEMAMFMGIVVI